MAKVIVQLNHRAFKSWLASAEAEKVAAEGAEKILAKAKSIAPVESGAYRDSLAIQPGRGWDGRAAADVVATVEYAALVEVRKQVLRRAVG